MTPSIRRKAAAVRHETLLFDMLMFVSWEAQALPACPHSRQT